MEAFRSGRKVGRDGDSSQAVVYGSRSTVSWVNVEITIGSRWSLVPVTAPFAGLALALTSPGANNPCPYKSLDSILCDHRVPIRGSHFLYVCLMVRPEQIDPDLSRRPLSFV